MHRFEATIDIIGINPFVFVPDAILQSIFETAGKNKGQIPVKLEIAGQDFVQTLVRYSGEWRLYLNGPMREVSKTVVGDTIAIGIAFDSSDRTTPMHPKLQNALDEDAEAKAVFENLAPSHQKEVMRYINNLKSEESIDRNVIKAIAYLHGKERFVGREKPTNNQPITNQ
jgi:Bacteriocin-protection, YdeI or OmpD-Associated/Domain of unknown function (DUF1905)